jgi:hypothetical protein
MVFAVALVGVVLWNMPSTMSTFSGEHSFYNVSKVDCLKCHSDILTQMSDVGMVNNLHFNNSDSCKICHTISQDEHINSSEGYHSGFKPNCVGCHPNVSIEIRGVNESHSLVVSSANGSIVNMGINEACIMCHTKIPLSVEIRNRTIFAFDNDSVAVNGSTPIFNGSYFVTVENSPTAGIHNFRDNVSCTFCHTNVQSILTPSHLTLGCTGCHRNESDGNYHAAETKHCSDCHNESKPTILSTVSHQSVNRDCNKCHYSHGKVTPTAHGNNCMFCHRMH